MKLVLFDVDGTLISTKGAGMRAFYRALQSVFDIRVESEVIRPDGKTDPLILRELLSYFGLAEHWCKEARAKLFAEYLRCLEDEMSQAKSRGLIRILPGVLNLLQSLQSQEDLAVGLVTGNLEKRCMSRPRGWFPGELDKLEIHRYPGYVRQYLG